MKSGLGFSTAIMGMLFLNLPGPAAAAAWSKSSTDSYPIAASINKSTNAPESLLVESLVESNVENTPVAIALNLGDIFENIIQYVQVSTISDQQEVELGRQINRMLLSQQYRLYNDRQVQQYVEQLGQRLVAVSDRRDIPYNFQVVVSDAINAFAVPGGYIYVTTGLLRTVDNEAQLASVLAHEIAHINQRHSIKALRQAVLAQGLAETVGIDMNTLAQIGYQLAINLPRSREFEYAADTRGLQILQAAGYPPQAFVNFLEQLMDAAATPEFLRTHPTTVNRIQAIRAQYEASTNASQQGTSQGVYEAIIFPLN